MEWLHTKNGRTVYLCVVSKVELGGLPKRPAGSLSLRGTDIWRPSSTAPRSAVFFFFPRVALTCCCPLTCNQLRDDHLKKNIIQIRNMSSYAAPSSLHVFPALLPSTGTSHLQAVSKGPLLEFVHGTSIAVECFSSNSLGRGSKRAPKDCQESCYT